jgi:transcriptional regulator with XRE-family HTH domain
MATTQSHPAYGSVLLAVAIAPEEIGEKIKAARKRRHWTQLAFALEAHVSPSSVARWEAGGLPPVRELIRIAEVLGIPAEQLVEPEPDDVSDREFFAATVREMRATQDQILDELAALRKERAPDSPARSRRAGGRSA